MLSGLATRARPWNLGLHLLSSLTLQSSASFGHRSMMYGSTQQSALLGQSPTSRLCPKAMSVSHAAPPRCSILPLGASSRQSPQHVTPDGERLISNSGSKAEERLRNTRVSLHYTSRNRLWTISLQSLGSGTSLGIGSHCH